MKYNILLFICILGAQLASAQNKAYRCADNITRKYRPEFDRESRILIGAAGLASLPISNTGKVTGSNYSTSTITKFNVFALYSIDILPRHGIYAGLSYNQNKQGLKFNISSNSNTIVEKSFSTLDFYRLMLGYQFKVNDKVAVLIGPSFAYSEYFEDHTTGRYNLPDGYIAGYSQEWQYEDYESKFIFSGDIIVAIDIWKRFGACAMIRSDFSPSIGTAGVMVVKFGDGTNKEFKGVSRPIMGYLGAGITYRFM